PRLPVRASPAALRPQSRAGLLPHRLVPALPRSRRAARLARGELAPQGLPEGAHQPRARRRGAAPREGLRLAELPGSLPGDRRPLPKTPLERGAARTFPHAAPALSRRAVLESPAPPRRASRPPPQSVCV